MRNRGSNAKKKEKKTHTQTQRGKRKAERRKRDVREISASSVMSYLVAFFFFLSLCAGHKEGGLRVGWGWGRGARLRRQV